MTYIKFSNSDLLRDKIVDPGWYTLLINTHRTWTPTKDGQSENMHFDCIIERNGDNGDTTFAGVPIILMFNSKPTAQGFIRGFLRALGVELAADKMYDMNAAVGRRIDAFIENNMYNGRLSNKANNSFRQTREE